MSDERPREQAPDGLELRHLRAFLAVAEELNFGRAATRLYVSPSTLSRQVAALERTLGCVLLRRSTRHVALTLAGRTLLDRLPAVLDDMDEAVEAVRSAGGQLAARIRRLGDPFAELTFDDVDALRAAAERHYALLPIVPEVAFTPVVAGGVPALVAEPPDPGSAWTLLLHGGNYTNGSAFGFRSLASGLADAAGCRVLTPTTGWRPSTRSPPPWTTPAPPTPGCSARSRRRRTSCWSATGPAPGSCSLLLRLKERAGPLPARCVLFTPFIAVPDALPATPAPSDTREGMALGVARYLDGHPVDDPLVNPLHADLSGLPPMLVQAAAEHEGLPDAERLTEHARSCKVDVRLEIYPVAAESFQLYWSFLPEAAAALTQFAEYICPAGPASGHPRQSAL